MYIQYFGLKENPFALPPDPRYLYLGHRHQEALAHLMYGITEGGGFVQLTGEVGTGKTMMIRAMLERLPDTVDVVFVLYPFLSVSEFIQAIFDELHIPRPEGASLKAMIDALNAYLLENHAKGRRTVLVVDEAHKLSREVLEQIRLLTNLETTKEKLLQIILVGQPELNEMLAQQDLRQIAQRITARYNLNSLSSEEGIEYVAHRCRVAGAQLPLFNLGALRAIHRRAAGIPRVMNTLCDRALLSAYAVGKPQVNAALVRQCANEAKAEMRPLSRQVRIAALSSAGLAVAASLVIATWWFWPMRSESVTTSSAAQARSGDFISALRSAVVTPVGAAKGNAASTGSDGSLEALLVDDNIPTDTDTAFTRLFAYWQRDYAQYSGATGCDRAQQAGLRCLFDAGTWNNLRLLNRPVILELSDSRGGRHHVLVSALKTHSVSIELGDQVRDFPLTEVDKFWYGKYLALWNPPDGNDLVLRRGMQGPYIQWLRDTLARVGFPTVGRSDLFDGEIESKVKEFQRHFQLEADGVVGTMTLIMLTTYDKGAPLLARSDTTTTAR